MPFTPAQIKVFANAGPRIEHLDSKGGGFITRTFYAQPYTAYPYAETFLKGTMVQGNNGTWGRVKPHADPIKPWFFCSDVKVVPFSPETITGMPVAPFAPSVDYSIGVTPAAGSQQAAINGVLNCVDDHSYGNIIDFANSPPLTPAQIAAGGIQYPNDGTSTGKCGAYIVATYTPLIFLDGLQTSGDNPQDPFDYVNPIKTAEVVSTQTGRSLFLYSPNAIRALSQNPLYLAGSLGPIAKTLLALGITSGNSGNAGLSDTFSRPEVIWHLTIKRLMVKYRPQLTEGAYASKINAIDNATIGNLKFPQDCLRFDKMDSEMVMGPDGTTWYNLTLHWSQRMLWEDIYQDIPPTDVGTFASKKGWVTWNYAYGIPADRITGIQLGSAGYYPVVWNAGAFQLFGGPRLLYLRDGQANSPPGYMGNFTGAMTNDLFTAGQMLGQ